MAGFLYSMAWNAAEATLVALAVAAVCRSRRVSAPLRHTLWLLVLVKLLMPPVAAHSLGLSAWRTRGVEVFRTWMLAVCGKPAAAPSVATASESTDRATRLVPDSASLGAPVASITLELLIEELSLAAAELDELRSSLGAIDSASPGAAVPETASPERLAGPVTAVERLPVTRPRWTEVLSSRWTSVLPFAAWAAGAALIATKRLRQALAVRRVICAAESAPTRVVAACKRLSRGLGVARPPAVRVTGGAISPMVCSMGRPVIVLPAGLICSSADDERVESVLAHELAHLRRRDHWVCWFELVASVVYWWHPVFWWSRTQMRRAADEAADAWAVAALGSRRAYAKSLLGTVEFLIADRAAAVLGPALGERDTIARRLNMIMKEPLRHRLSWPAWLGIAVIGLLVLPAAPKRLTAQESKQPPAPPSTPPTEEEFNAVLEALEPETQPQPGQGAAPRGRRGAQQPPGAPPGAPAASGPRGGQGRPDPERRLQELEEKVERVLKMLEGRHGPSGGRDDGAAPGAAGPMGRIAMGGIAPFMRGQFGGQPGGQTFGGAASGFGTGPGGFGPGTGMGGGAFGGIARGGMGAGFGRGGAANARPAMPNMPGMSGGPRGAGEPGIEMPFNAFSMRSPALTPSPRDQDEHNPQLLGQRLRELNLSPEQRERLEHMHRDARAEMVKIETEQARVMAEFQRRRGEVERSLGEAINNVLTPDQRERRQADRPEGNLPRPNAEPRRGPDQQRPRESAEPRREPGPERPREGAEPRRAPNADRPREGGDRPREGVDRPREGGDRPREAGEQRREGDYRSREGGDVGRRPSGDRPPGDRGADRRPEEGQDREEAGADSEQS